MFNVRRNGDARKLEQSQKEKATDAVAYYIHLRAYLESIGARIEDLSYWNEPVKRQNTLPTNKRIGKILLGSPANIVDSLLEDTYLANSQLRMVEAANSSGGINRTTRRYEFALPLTQNHSYEELCSMMQEHEGLKDLILQSEDDSLVDYILIGGKDPATKQEVLIELGNPPIQKPSILSLFFPQELIRRVRSVH